ncbi:uncharacterized protein LOC111369992 [Olea europaea var. sylvestris]|uniref:uncharacterized protein LOC111369992 n=1 Tax=Olea europaea var. sylvestris TaxID=158386 RepID=UPI000C1D1731|nr:uncharacterized protein LOC111369992 [Olea europaea var. sylvestris]
MSMDRIFCFCCKLFKTPINVTKVGQLGNDGFKDWHNLHRSIKSHEGNEEHLRCMTNASQEEQMSLIVRFVDNSSNLPTVQERWLEFLKVDDTTGLRLATKLQRALIKIDLDIDDIRGQGYDNESNKGMTMNLT